MTRTSYDPHRYPPVTEIVDRRDLRSPGRRETDRTERWSGPIDITGLAWGHIVTLRNDAQAALDAEAARGWGVDPATTARLAGRVMALNDVLAIFDECGHA
jgi:hypothetical protein